MLELLITSPEEMLLSEHHNDDADHQADIPNQNADSDQNNEQGSGSHHFESIGNGNFNFAGRDLNGNVHFQSSQPFVQRLDVHRAWKIPLHIRPRTLGIVGILSFLLTLVGTFASLLSLIAPDSYPPLVTDFGAFFHGLGPWAIVVLMAFGIIAAACGFQLLRSHFAHVGPVALERDMGGSMWLTSLTGPCPKCAGTLHMHGGPRGGVPGCYLTCSANPQHSWQFDYTSLDPIAA